MDYTMRQAKPSDADALLKYYQQVGAESDQLLFGSEGLPMTSERYALLLKEMQLNDREILLVVIFDDTIIACGNISAAPVARKRIAHRSRIALSVSKAWWGKGIGTKLLAQLINEAKQMQEVCVVSLEVKADNVRAIALYEKFNFERFAIDKKFFKINQQFYDALLMNLYL